MLSYVLPAKEENGKRKLSLNLNNQIPNENSNDDLYGHGHDESDLILANVSNAEFCNDLTKLIETTTAPSRRCNNNNSFSDGLETMNESLDEFDISLLESDPSCKHSTMQDAKKTKLCKIGTKAVGLKRVSFGSSKGSMVETLVFETPTPLSEHAEPNHSFESAARSKSPNYKPYIDDSGIDVQDVQDDLERAKVRVSIYQSSKPQQISHPDYLTKLTENLEESICNYNYDLNIMPTTAISGYDRQQSSDSGWDNPFRPGGDLSREAEEIVNMIKGGKPITPTDEHKIENGKDNLHNGAAVIESVTKSTVTQVHNAQNGSSVIHSDSKGNSNENNGVTTSTNQVSKQVVPGPTSASHVVIDEKKNKKKGCCTIQ